MSQNCCELFLESMATPTTAWLRGFWILIFLLILINVFTWLNAGERKCVLPYKIIPGRHVVVLHDKAYYCQLRRMDHKL